MVYFFRWWPDNWLCICADTEFGERLGVIEMNKSLVAFLACGTVAAAFAPVASAEVIVPGIYRLHDHPDGAIAPPPYGLRLVELYDVTAGNDNFTFDFDHADSEMFLTFTGTEITISGVSMGGRDTGAAWAADAYLGLYSFSFTYSIGVSGVPGDDDIYVVANMDNTGTVTTPLGDTLDLLDKSNGSFSFRLGDESDDAGHRGFAGISGWGWLTYPAGAAPMGTDWIFTAELVPAPSALALLGAAGLFRSRRRR